MTDNKRQNKGTTDQQLADELHRESDEGYKQMTGSADSSMMGVNH